MICQRCAKDLPAIHTCTPSDLVRKLEAEIAEDRKYMDAMAAECQAMIRLNGEQLATIEALQKDAERLNFLDENLSMQMGWRVARAPAGNISVQSVIQLATAATSIRAAIDAALAKDSSHE